MELDLNKTDWPEGILKACKFLGLTLPNVEASSSYHCDRYPTPSDYLGKDFQFDKQTLERLIKLSKMTSKKFRYEFSKFKDVYFSHTIFNHNETDVNIFFADYIITVPKGVFAVRDYFDFEFYRKSPEERRKFFGDPYVGRILAILNDHSSYHLLEHKPTTNRTFAAYIHREWLDTTDCDFEEFKRFVELHPKFFAKPINDNGGHRAEIGTVNAMTDIEAEFNRYRENKMMVEELISQHPALSEFSPNAVCTIRVNAMTDPHGVVHILTTGGRIGRVGGIVDNYSSGGMSVITDPQTGIIVSDAINKFHERSAKHPDTGKTFRGFQYPCWDKVRAAVIEMMKVVPSLKFAGWDITVTNKNEIELVEANQWPGVRVQQSADGIGKFHLYKPLLDEWRHYNDTQIKLVGWRVNNLSVFPKSYHSTATRRDNRVQLALEHLIENCQSVMDVGCRQDKFIKTILPANVEYYPVDYQKYDEQTIVCDFRAGELPDIKVDTCLCVITAEYVEQLKDFLNNLCNTAQRQILMVCRPIDRENNQYYRWQHPILTDFTEKFLINSLAANGFELQKSESLPNNKSLIIYDFRLKNRSTEKKHSSINKTAVVRKGVWSDGILRACNKLELQLPNEVTANEIVPNMPSDCLGRNFKLDDEMRGKLQKESGLTVEKFEGIFKKFRHAYFTQSVFKHNDTDLNVFFVDYITSAHERGYSVADYFDFEFYSKDVKIRDTFFGERHLAWVQRVCNPSENMRCTKNKAIFNSMCRKYVQRDWLDTTTCSVEEFRNFVEKHRYFFSKPRRGSLGHGAGIFTVQQGEDFEALLKRYRSAERIVEEIIEQHEALNEICPDVLNTIRINTLVDCHNSSHILTAAGRFGRVGAIVDNFHGGGSVVLIDPKTGVVISDAINAKHERVAKHPDTGKTFRGFQYPCWDKVRTAVTEMSKAFSPYLKYIGWDVAITDKSEIEIVEGNSRPGVDVQQAPDSVGRTHIFSSVVLELEKYKFKQLQSLGWRSNNIDNFEELYRASTNAHNSRAQFAMDYLIEGCQSVMDVGCRQDKFVKTILPKDIKYYPVDYQKYDGETIVCNLREGELPCIKVDTCLCVITAEYVELLQDFLDNLCNTAQRQILMVCRPVDKEQRKYYRWKYSFLTDFTEKFLIDSITKQDFYLHQSKTLPDNRSVILYDFRRN